MYYLHSSYPFHLANFICVENIRKWYEMQQRKLNLQTYGIAQSDVKIEI